MCIRDREKAVKAYMEYAGTEEIMIFSSAYDCILNKCIGRFAESYSECPSGMYQIFDFANVLEAYLTLKQRTLAVSYTHLDVYKRQVLQMAGLSDRTPLLISPMALSTARS